MADIYQGRRGPSGATVTRISDWVSWIIPWRLEMRNHSPTGLEWGFYGSGPAQCALALLCDATQDREWSLEHYQQYKNQVVGSLPREWQFPVAEVREWCCKQGFKQEGT